MERKTLDTNIIHKELDLVQDVIKRMADNSFKVKAWMMSIFGFVVAIANSGLIDCKNADNSLPMEYVAVFLFVTVMVFWYLDAFFLRTEKLYREVYKWVVKYRPLTDKYLYDLNTFVREFDGQKVDLRSNVPSIVGVMFSKTLLPFYLLPFLLSVALFFLG